MWHIHPQQQQRGIQFEPLAPSHCKEAHAHGEKGATTTRDVNGLVQTGWAKRPPAGPAQLRALAARVTGPLP